MWHKYDAECELCTYGKKLSVESQVRQSANGSEINSTLQLVYLVPLGLMTLLIIVFSCTLCQVFGKILANTVKESVHDESSEVPCNKSCRQSRPRRTCHSMSDDRLFWWTQPCDILLPRTVSSAPCLCGSPQTRASNVYTAGMYSLLGVWGLLGWLFQRTLTTNSQSFPDGSDETPHRTHRGYTVVYFVYFALPVATFMWCMYNNNNNRFI